MTRGRRPMGPKLVENLDGSENAKQRLEVILETIAGKRSVEDACRSLGIQVATFHKLRGQALGAALDACEPKPAGRPAQVPTEEQQRVAELEDEIRELEFQLRAAQARAELAVAMPHVLKPGEPDALKKTAQFVQGARRAGGGPGRASSGGKPGM